MGCRCWVPSGHFVIAILLSCATFTQWVALTASAGAQSLSISAYPSSTVALAELQDQFQAVARQVAPTVVAISASAGAVDTDEALRADALNGDKLESLLNRTTRTVGTGFIINADGYVLTNEHVIADAQQLWVTTDDGKVYPAMIIGSDPRGDLAVLKIPAANLPVVQFAPPNSVRRGSWTIAMGNPYGLAEAGELAMSVGVVSATDRSLPKLSSRENRAYANLIQTTAEINPGNSGGPLFDLQGRVIGITSAVVMPQKQINGIGFAMPVNDELLARIHDLQEGREIVYGYLGVVVSTPSTHDRRNAGAAGEVGVLIESVEHDSPADATLQVGDFVTNVDGSTVRDSDQFVRTIGFLPIGRPTRVDLLRDGHPLSVEVSTRKRATPSVAVTRENLRFRWNGLLLGPIPANWNVGATPRPAQGVMVLGVDAKSPLAKDGIQPGVVITSIAGKTVSDLIELQKIINDTPAELCRIELAGSSAALASSGRD